MVFAVGLTLAIGTSWLLLKIVPGLETGAAITIGVVATVFSLYTVFKIFGAVLKETVLSNAPEPRPKELWDEDDDESPLVYAVPPFPARRRKFKRRPRQ